MVEEQKDGVILDVSVAVPRYVLSHDALAEARGIDPDKYRYGLGCEEMSVCGPGEDTVTLAAEAAWRLLKGDPERLSRVGMCIVGTESNVDASKSIASTLHGLLGLRPACRVFDIQHACYGATAALQMARSWVRQYPRQLALVIASDVARYERCSPGEPTQGAGAVGLLIGAASPRDACLTLSAVSGTYASDVNDFWRPTYQKTACVKGKFSVDCYLKGMVEAYDDYKAQVKASAVPEHMLFHAPFPHMARKAHRRLMVHQGHTDEIFLADDYRRRVEPSLWANRRVGNIYTGSLYLSLAALCEQEGDDLTGCHAALFSYGSGSCSEYFTGRFGQAVARPGLQAMLDARDSIGVSRYEVLSDASLALEQNQSFCEDIAPRKGQPFTFLGIRDHERVYRQNEIGRRGEDFARERVESLPRAIPGRDPGVGQRPLLDGVAG